MIDQVSYRTKIVDVADDGSVTMKVEVLGVTLRVFGDSASVVFSTIDPSINKTALSHDYSDVFRYLNGTPFTAEISPDGTVRSISGPIKKKIRKVKRNIPSNKVNGKSVRFFTDEILSTGYLKNALSMGWIHREPSKIEDGAVQKNVVETPPIPGESSAGAVSFIPVKTKRLMDTRPETYLLTSRAGFGDHLRIGKAGIEVVADTNMVKTVGMDIEQIQKGVRFQMKYNRKSPKKSPF